MDEGTGGSLEGCTRHMADRLSSVQAPAAVLHSWVLCCAVLLCAVLYYTLVCRDVLHCCVLYCAKLQGVTKGQKCAVPHLPCDIFDICQVI